MPGPTRPHHPRRASLLIATLLAVACLAGLPSAVQPVGAQVAADRLEPVLPGPVAGWSTTTGTDGRVYIADELGRARQFHGFNHKTEDPDTLTDELLAAAADRGMDHVRLSYYWHELEPAEGEFDEEYLGRIVAALDRAEAHGILAVVSMHQDVFGPAFGFAGIPEWATRDDGHPFTRHDNWLLNYLEPAVQAAFDHLYEDEDLRAFQIRAWLTVVEAVKDHPAVLGYDLLNEPFGKFREGEDLFTAAARVEREQLTPMFQRLTDAITAVDPDHWVFFKPPNLASLGVATSLGLVEGPKVAIYPHMYDSSIEFATYTPGGVIQYDPAFFTNWQAAITTYTDRHPMPLLVGEWGIARPEAGGMAEFVQDSLNTLDQVGAGWSMFNWCMGEGYCPIDSAGNDRPAIGQIFLPYARAIGGAPTSTTWDFDAAVLEVTFADGTATGPTEIFVPESRSYPAGWKVETSDPDGTWSYAFDEATGVLAVTTAPSDEAHTICVKPAGAPDGCEVPSTEPTPPPGPPGTTPVGPAQAAAPQSGHPGYTG